MVKRVALIGAAAVVSVLATATAALAESTYPVPPPGGSVEGASGGTAFTGASGLPFGLVMVAVLLVVGVGALLAARRWSGRLGS